MSTKRKSRINKTCGYASDIINRELQNGASEDDDFDDVADCLDCSDQPACLNIDSVNRLSAEAAAGDEVDETDWRDTEVGDQYKRRLRC